MILRCFDHFVTYSPIITTAFTQTNIDNFIEHQRGFPLSLEPSDITAGNRDISHGKYLRSALADLGIHVAYRYPVIVHKITIQGKFINAVFLIKCVKCFVSSHADIGIIFLDCVPICFMHRFLHLSLVHECIYLVVSIYIFFLYEKLQHSAKYLDTYYTCTCSKKQ